MDSNQPVSQNSPVNNQPNISQPANDKAPTVALALVWIHPIGVILMWHWMKNWKTLTKILISLPTIIGFVYFIAILIFSLTLGRNASGILKKNLPPPTPPLINSNNLAPTYYPPFSASPAATLVPLQSTADIPMIASVVTDYLLKNGYNHPEISFKSNDGTFATGGVSELGSGGGAIWFAYKIKGQWTMVYVGNGNPKCSDIAKYNLPPNLLSCY